MAKRNTISKEYRRAIRDARSMIADAEKADCNEAETRRRIEKIFENLMGYDPFKHLTRERAIRGAGETEHVDFAIELGEGDDIRPVIMIEIKRVAMDLATKHLKQVSSYAINAGCEWILLTNSREWKLYHVTFGQPPITRAIHTWNLLTDDIDVLAEMFELISLKSVNKNALDKLWEKRNILQPQNLLSAMFCIDSLNAIRRELRRDSGVNLAPEDIVGGMRHLFNELALKELEDVRISLQPKRRASKKKAAVQATAELAAQAEATATKEPAPENDTSPVSDVPTGDYVPAENIEQGVSDCRDTTPVDGN